MPSAHIMQLPFTTKKEILDWETRYLKKQSKNRQVLEAAVIGFSKNVSERGYLRKAELRVMGQWKDHRLPSKLDENQLGRIEDVTGEAFRLDDDWEKLQKLTDIEGVAESVASVILHLYDSDLKKYPILDKHALRSIGIDSRKVKYDEPFWRKYVNFLSNCIEVFSGATPHFYCVSKDETYLCGVIPGYDNSYQLQIHHFSLSTMREPEIIVKS